MSKEIIKIGHTNIKYKIGNTFVLVKQKNDFNHKINYQKLTKLDFVPQLIEETPEKITWQWIDAKHLDTPTDQDLKQLAKNMRALHKSDLKFPKNNFHKRIMAYLKTYNAKGIKVQEIDDYYKEMSKLISRMGRLNPCHNDLWSQNILKDTNNKLWLVDWEYATMGDKHFDLAFFIQSAQLNTHQEQVFLQAYNSYDDYQAYIEEWMILYKRFSVWLTILWAHAQKNMPFDLAQLKNYLKKTAHLIKR